MTSRQGTYLIEAAVVLPVIVLTVITVILIVMYCYDGSVSQSRLHRALRYEAAMTAGNVKDYAFEQDRAGLEEEIYFEHGRRQISASKNISMLHEGILYDRGGRTLTASVHITNSVKYALRRQKIEAFIESRQSGKDE